MISKDTLLPRVLLGGSAVVVAFLGWYLFVLLGRTHLLAQSTSVGRDVIAGFHVLALLAAAASAWARRRAATRWGGVILASACVVEITFLGLNWFGRVWEYQKEGPASLAASVVQLLRGAPR